MYHRYHPKTSRRPSGKWERIPHTGVGQITHEEIGEWEVKISHRKVGVSIKRDQYTAIIRRESPDYEESLTGFRSKAAALEAARKRIDLLSHVRQPIARGPHRWRGARHNS